MNVRLGNRIGDGGFADVWSAEDELGREVAVKLVRASAAVISDAEAHARALVRAAHPNIVAVYSIETIKDPETGNDVRGIVMELLRGETLQRRLKGRMLERQEVQRIGQGLLDGLAHIHSIGLSHGDLHAGNIMLTSNGEVKVIDILYTDSLAEISSASREKRMEWDCRNVRMLLQDLLTNSDIEATKLSVFGAGLSINSKLDEIRIAFNEATSVSPLSEEKIDFHYSAFDDESFVKGEVYADALSDDTPDDVILPLLLRAIELRRMTDDRIPYVRNLWNRLSDAQQATLIEALSAALDAQIPKRRRYAPLLRLMKGFGAAHWRSIKLVIRLRLEAAIANDILNGRIDYYAGAEIKGGHLGTWAITFGRYFTDTAQIIEALTALLYNNWETQNYVGEYFLPALSTLARTDDQREALLSGLQRAINSNAFLIKKNLEELPREWQESLHV